MVNLQAKISLHLNADNRSQIAPTKEVALLLAFNSVQQENGNVHRTKTFPCRCSQCWKMIWGLSRFSIHQQWQGDIMLSLIWMKIAPFEVFNPLKKYILCKIGWPIRKRLVWRSRHNNDNSKIKPTTFCPLFMSISCTAIKQLVSIYHLFAIHVWWLEYYLVICVLLVDVFEEFWNLSNGISLKLFLIDHSWSSKDCLYILA